MCSSLFWVNLKGLDRTLRVIVHVPKSILEILNGFVHGVEFSLGYSQPNHLASLRAEDQR